MFNLLNVQAGPMGCELANSGIKGRLKVAIERQVDHALGSIERPMDDLMLTAKLHDLADGVIGKRATELLVERAPDASVVVGATCGRVGPT